MSVYVLFMQGIVSKEIKGVYSTQAMAAASFWSLYEAQKLTPKTYFSDFDGYHDFLIQEFQVDGSAAGQPIKIDYEPIKEAGHE